MWAMKNQMNNKKYLQEANVYARGPLLPRNSVQFVSQPSVLKCLLAWAPTLCYLHFINQQWLLLPTAIHFPETQCKQAHSMNSIFIHFSPVRWIISAEIIKIEISFMNLLTVAWNLFLGIQFYVTNPFNKSTWMENLRNKSNWRAACCIFVWFQESLSIIYRGGTITILFKY